MLAAPVFTESSVMPELIRAWTSPEFPSVTHPVRPELVCAQRSVSHTALLHQGGMFDIETVHTFIRSYLHLFIHSAKVTLVRKSLYDAAVLTLLNAV